MTFSTNAMAAVATCAVISVMASAASAATYTFTFDNDTVPGSANNDNPSTLVVESDGPGDTIEMTIMGNLYNPGRYDESLSQYDPGTTQYVPVADGEIDIDSNNGGLISKNGLESGGQEDHTLDSRPPEGNESFKFTLDGPDQYILHDIQIGWSEAWIGGDIWLSDICGGESSCSTGGGFGPEDFAFYDLFVDGTLVGNTYVEGGPLTPAGPGNEFVIGVRGFEESLEIFYPELPVAQFGDDCLEFSVANSGFDECSPCYYGFDECNPCFDIVKTDSISDICEPLSLTLDFGIKVKALTFKHVPSEVIPLPAAGWLLLAGMGGLVALKRRKRS